MRWDYEYQLKPLEHEYDVFISAKVGLPFVPGIYEVGAIGGTEFECCLLLEELARQGLKVGCASPIHYPTRSKGVDCFPINEIGKTNIIKTKILISMRNQPPQEGIYFQKLVNWLTDLVNPSEFTYIDSLQQEIPFKTVGVSKFHTSLFRPTWKGTTIYNMIPDWVYDFPKVKKDPFLFCYTSAVMKGLKETLELWHSMRNHFIIKKSKLLILSPGYDRPDFEEMKKVKNIEWMGMLPFKKVVEVTAKSGGLFMVSRVPETFGISLALSEIVGTVPHILTINHPGALPEILNAKTITSDVKMFEQNIIKANKNELKCENPKDFRISSILPEWIKLFQELLLN